MTDNYETPLADSPPLTPRRRGKQSGRGGETESDGRATQVSVEDRLRVLTSIVGKLAIPEKRLSALVTPKGNLNYIRAYNLCDGAHTVADVADRVGLDPANFRKLAQRWIDSGIMFRVGKNADLLLHLYPLGLTLELTVSRDDDSLADVSSR